jgi:hypothetical protein
MKKLLLIAFCFNLASCGAMKEYGPPSSGERCESYGHTKGTSAYATCIGNEERAKRERRAEKRAANDEWWEERSRAREQRVWDRLSD